MALFENFPYTNLHELNLDWLIENIKKLGESQVMSVNGETGDVILYQSENMQLPDVESNVWQIIRTTDGVTAGIHFNSTTGMATIVNGQTLDQIYTHDHPPVYPVYSVNGQTGAVVTYPEQYVRLPDLDDAQMTNWTLFRHLNNVSRGIQFDDDGSVYVIDGMNRYKIYTANAGDAPPYPVTSVNGSTGAVQLYTEQYIQLPALSDPSMTEWTLFRLLNNVTVGFKLNDDGSVSVLNGNDEYPVYIEGINDPSDFNDPADAVLELSEDVALADGKTWGMVRTIEDGNSTVGIVFKYNTLTSEYETFLKVGSTETKLLTAADIPPGSVVSVNGQTGAVVLTGEDIDTHPGSTHTISDIADMVLPIANDIAIIVDGDTSTQNISVGDFVLVLESTITGISNGLYIAVNAVVAGTSVVAADLTNAHTAKGGLNYFSNDTPLTYTMNTGYTIESWGFIDAYRIGNICIVAFNGVQANSNYNTERLLLTIPGINIPHNAYALTRAGISGGYDVGYIRAKANTNEIYINGWNLAENNMGTLMFFITNN